MSDKVSGKPSFSGEPSIPDWKDLSKPPPKSGFPANTPWKPSPSVVEDVPYGNVFGWGLSKLFGGFGAALGAAASPSPLLGGEEAALDKMQASPAWWHDFGWSPKEIGQGEFDIGEDAFEYYPGDLQQKWHPFSVPFSDFPLDEIFKRLAEFPNKTGKISLSDYEIGSSFFATSPYYDEELGFIRPGQVLPGGRKVEDLLPLAVNPRPGPDVDHAYRFKPGSEPMVPQLDMAVRPDGSISVQRRLVTERSQYQPRYKDTKYGKKLVAVVERMVTATYGTYTEIMDFADALAHNVYGIGKFGDVMPAMALEDGSYLGVMKGIGEGKYQVDLPGFALDFGLNQFEDFAFGLYGQAWKKSYNMVGTDAYWQASRFVQAADRITEGPSDVLSSWLSSAQSFVRSQDRLRQKRAADLFR